MIYIKKKRQAHEDVAIFTSRNGENIRNHVGISYIHDCIQEACHFYAIIGININKNKA